MPPQKAPWPQPPIDQDLQKEIVCLKQEYSVALTCKAARSLVVTGAAMVDRRQHVSSFLCSAADVNHANRFVAFLDCIFGLHS